MSEHVTLEAFELLIESLNNYSDNILNGTKAMTNAVSICQEAMGSDEYSMAIVKNLEDCLVEYQNLIKLIGDEIKYLQKEKEMINKIKY